MRKVSLECVYSLAKTNEKILYMGSDVGAGTLADFKKSFPYRFFMEGVSEQHIIGMASGLAMEGYIPYVNTIATFLTRRCYEQVAIDVCLPNLPVKLIANGGGLVYAPLGPTHLAIDDIALMSTLPNMNVVAVADELEMQLLMSASVDIDGPLYIRLGKGNEPIIYKEKYGFEFGRASMWKEPGDVLIISTGVMTHDAITVAELAAEYNIEVGVMHMHTIKPLDCHAILKYAPKVNLLITLEEHLLHGGLGSAVVECLADCNDIKKPIIKRFGIKDRFPAGYGSQREMIDREISSPHKILKYITEEIGCNV